MPARLFCTLEYFLKKGDSWFAFIWDLDLLVVMKVFNITGLAKENTKHWSITTLILMTRKRFWVKLMQLVKTCLHILTRRKSLSHWKLWFNTKVGLLVSRILSNIFGMHAIMEMTKLWSCLQSIHKFKSSYWSKMMKEQVCFLKISYSPKIPYFFTDSKQSLSHLKRLFA